jgi:hypothetical protein
VKILSCGEQSVSFDEEENVSDNSSTQHGKWEKSGSEQPRFPFAGKPGNDVDLDDSSNLLEYFHLFCTLGVAEVIAREKYQHTKQFLENMPNQKLRSRTHRWKETNRNEIMMLLAFFLL